MNLQLETHSRREFIRSGAMLSASMMAGHVFLGTATAAIAPIRRSGGPRLKTAINAYSFSRLLNQNVKQPGAGMSLLDLVDFCARQNVDGLDATGYFFSTYPKPPSDAEVNTLKRRAFDCGIDFSGTGVRNNFTTADKTVRDASVQHIKEWVEVAARLGAPVLRVFVDTQMKAQTWQTVAPDCTREQVEEWIAGHLRDCAEHAQKFGVIIGVQNHGDFVKTGAEHLGLLHRVDSEWCGAIVDTGYYKTDDPYTDMALVAPHAVNWQIKESPFGAGNEVRTDMTKLLTLIRMAGYRGYLPIETLSASGQEYDPFDCVAKFHTELKEAIDATAHIAPPLEPEPPRPAVNDATPSARPAGRKPANKKKTP